MRIVPMSSTASDKGSFGKQWTTLHTDSSCTHKLDARCLQWFCSADNVVVTADNIWLAMHIKTRLS